MFYPSAKIIVKHPSDPRKILMVKRFLGEKVSFEPAGGKLEIDFARKTAETLEECATREAQEELGLLVSIEKYLGSYYFFWSIDSSKCSSCALFVGSIVEVDKNFKKNSDTCELPLEPAWVDVNDVLTKKITIDNLHVGLENILINYLKSLI